METLTLTYLRKEIRAYYEKLISPPAILDIINKCTKQLDDYEAYQIDRFRVSFTGSDLKQLMHIYEVFSNQVKINPSHLQTNLWANKKYRLNVLTKTCRDELIVSSISKKMDHLISEIQHGAH